MLGLILLKASTSQSSQSARFQQFSHFSCHQIPHYTEWVSSKAQSCLVRRRWIRSAEWICSAKWKPPTFHRERALELRLIVPKKILKWGGKWEQWEETKIERKKWEKFRASLSCHLVTKTLDNSWTNLCYRWNTTQLNSVLHMINCTLVQTTQELSQLELRYQIFFSRTFLFIYVGAFHQL